MPYLWASSWHSGIVSPLWSSSIQSLSCLTIMTVGPLSVSRGEWSSALWTAWYHHMRIVRLGNHTNIYNVLHTAHRMANQKLLIQSCADIWQNGFVWYSQIKLHIVCYQIMHVLEILYWVLSYLSFRGRITTYICPWSTKRGLYAACILSWCFFFC